MPCSLDAVHEDAVLQKLTYAKQAVFAKHFACCCFDELYINPFHRSRPVQTTIWFYRKQIYVVDRALFAKCKSCLDLFIWWFFTDSTMINHHSSPPIGRIFLRLFPGSLSKSKPDLGYDLYFWCKRFCNPNFEIYPNTLESSKSSTIKKIGTFTKSTIVLGKL